MKDSRTHSEYEIPIRHNTIDALALKKIKAPSAATNPADKVANGLRIYDPGLQNTAVAESKLTWMYDSEILHESQPPRIQILTTHGAQRWRKGVNTLSWLLPRAIKDL